MSRHISSSPLLIGLIMTSLTQRTFRDRRQRHLHQHTSGRVKSNALQWDGNDHLVKDGRKEKNAKGDKTLAKAGAKHWLVNVSHAPLVNWNVPRRPKVRRVLTVPPVAIKLTIGKAEQLGKEVEPRVKDHDKTNNPDCIVRHGQGDDFVQEDNLGFFCGQLIQVRQDPLLD